MIFSIDIGGIYRRNCFHKDPSTLEYYMIIERTEGSFSYCRRIHPDFLLHEEMVWDAIDLPLYFIGVK